MATASSPWQMTVPQPGGDYTPCPAGNHPGRIVGLYDVGHQSEIRQNKKSGLDEKVDVHKLVVVFELAKKQPGGQPHVLGQKFTWSMNDSSNFYKFVVAVTGQRFGAGTSFDPTGLLGLAVMVNVTNTTPNEKGQFYANVGAVTQYPDGFPEPTTTIEPRAWSLQEATPAPAESWLPKIYGMTISELVDDSAERRRPTPQAPAPAIAATRPPKGNPSYSAACLNLMTKYGLQVGYGADDVAEVSGRLRGNLPDAERDVLDEFAIPF